MGYASGNAIIGVIKRAIGLHKVGEAIFYDLNSLSSILSSGVVIRYCGRNYRATDACVHMAIFEPSEMVPTEGCRHVWAAPDEFIVFSMRAWSDLCKAAGGADKVVIGASRRKAWVSECAARAKRVKLEKAKVVINAARQFAVRSDIFAVFAGLSYLDDVFTLTIAFGYSGEASDDAREVRKNNMIIVAPQSKEWLVAYAVEPKAL
jgi:hypothetical protein